MYYYKNMPCYIGLVLLFCCNINKATAIIGCIITVAAPALCDWGAQGGGGKVNMGGPTPTFIIHVILMEYFFSTEHWQGVGG